jgi:cytoskeleton protein RodZ
MNSKRTSLSFGRYLQSIRLEKGISLEEVSKETRIRLENLLCIEKEDHEKLPAQIFVKGFLRAYAKVIGADEDEAVRRYEERYKTYQRVASSEAALIQLRASVWPNFRLMFIIVFCLMVLTVYSASTIHKNSLPGNNAKLQGLENKAIGSKRFGSNAANDTPASILIEEKKKLLLKVITIKETWIKVIVDGQSPEIFNLSVGDLLEFEAFSGFNLLIGDASGVNLLLNNEQLEVAGDDDQAVNIQIP